ncbi:LysR family transcriptional regulator [Paradevosia shaoguanensis]|uniref:LysR family transcriptional regulator n=1 Tax=Paradevosia shaoguanensis TaxID=1335043 RepID=A0AA41QLC4_9HYPH|nr:LysR family transcriptional regulator [Paradevosia shaoguanensis]MCF1742152.1 LysR family transcriptional regulator [Paradevosia shaoguanensis]MCI0126635.1 LysR family transcriptional regulator [Paradevosia shaoguanensis]
MKRVDPLAGVTTFLTLADLKSFTATAARLHISAATVSAQIADLETRLAVRLVQRSTRHVRLTEAGEAYRASLDGMLEQAERGMALASSLGGELSGALRISAPFGAAEWLMKHTIERYTREHTRVTIDVQYSTRVVDLVDEGFDIAIRGTHALEPNWIVRKIRNVAVYVAASPAFVDRCGAPELPQQLMAFDCLQYSDLSFGNTWLLQCGEVTERISIRPRMLSNSSSTLREWALGGLGIVLLPDFCIGEDLAQGRLVRLLPDWSPPGFELNVVYPDNKHISRKVKLFVEALIEDTRHYEAMQ